LINPDEGLTVQDTTTPVPQAADVLVKIHAVSLNNLEKLIFQGKYPDQKDAISPCSDMAGEVIAVGQAVTAWKAGD